jgi:hypothetical protein
MRTDLEIEILLGGFGFTTSSGAVLMGLSAPFKG